MANLLHNRRAVLALGIVVLILVALAGWQFIVSPQLNQGSVVSSNIDQLNAQTSLTHAKIQQECRKLNDIQSVLVQARNNQAKFPPTADVTQLFTQIRTAANVAGIPTQNISQVQAPAPVIGDVQSVAEMAVSITVTSRPNQVANFLAALEAMPRSFLVQNLAVTAGATPGTVAVTINGNAFIIQTKSLQQVLDDVNKARVDLKAQCHLTALPTIPNTASAIPTTAPPTPVTPTPTPSATTTPSASANPGTTPTPTGQAPTASPSGTAQPAAAGRSGASSGRSTRS